MAADGRLPGGRSVPPVHARGVPDDHAELGAVPASSDLRHRLCEIAGAIALNTRLRRAAGAALALYAVCVYPANIKHAQHGLPPGHLQLGWWYHAPRLALQPVRVWWALYAGEVIEWPFGQSAPRSGTLPKPR